MSPPPVNNVTGKMKRRRTASGEQLDLISELSKSIPDERVAALSKRYIGKNDLTFKAATKLIKDLKLEIKCPDRNTKRLRLDLVSKLEEKLGSLSPELLERYRINPDSKRKAARYRTKLRELIRRSEGKPPLSKKTRVKSNPLPSRRTLYLKYLRSPEWNAKKIEFRSSPHCHMVCFVCGKNSELDIHHDTYKNLGNEKMEDLLEMCRGCHIELHDRVKKRIYKRIEGSALKMKNEYLATM